MIKFWNKYYKDILIIIFLILLFADGVTYMAWMNSIHMREIKYITYGDYWMGSLRFLRVIIEMFAWIPYIIIKIEM
jgi:hypothetical protein